MPEAIGYQDSSKHIHCCSECGEIFYSIALEHSLCEKCTKKQNEFIMLESERKRKENRAKIRKTIKVQGKSIAEISAMAAKEGLSYGKFVAKYRF